MDYVSYLGRPASSIALNSARRDSDISQDLGRQAVGSYTSAPRLASERMDTSYDGEAQLSVLQLIFPSQLNGAYGLRYSSPT